MCLILFGSLENIQDLDLRKAWDCNDDGAGIIVLGKPATITKGLMSWKKFRKSLFRCPKNSNIAIHLRRATHGAVSPKWCHPFEAGEDCWLMHNGIFQTLGERGQNGMSDSAHLADILSYLPLTQKLSLLKEIVGYSNRCLLIKHDTFATFGNWHTLNHVQMSNPLLTPSIPYSYQGSQTAAASPNLPTTTNVRETYYKKGKWSIKRDYKNITEESKHQIDLPLTGRCNGDIAALPRRSEIANLFMPDEPEQTLYDAYLNSYLNND